MCTSLVALKHLRGVFSTCRGSKAQQMMHRSGHAGSVSWWEMGSQLLGVVWGTESVMPLKRDKCLRESNPPFKKDRSLDFLFIFKWGRRPSPFSLTNSWLHFETDKFKQDENQIASAYLVLVAVADNVINVAVREIKSVLDKNFFLFFFFFFRNTSWKGMWSFLTYY